MVQYGGDRSEALTFLTFAALRGVGYTTLFDLMSSTESLPELLNSGADRVWASLKSSGAKVDSTQFQSWVETRARASEAAAKQLDALDDLGVRLLFRNTLGFPKQLFDLRTPPHWLFVQGSVDILSEPSIAAVGTRKPTSDGLWLARFVGLCLGDWRAPTVSGLALGIDQEIHQSSVEQGAPTIAVLGTGILSDYPKNAKGLRERLLAAGGSIVTEYLPDESYSAQNFVHRNRLQAALGRVLVPIEWKEKSGTAHTVRYANTLGRPIAGLRLPHWHDEGVPPPGEFNHTFTIPGDEDEFRRFVEAALSRQFSSKGGQLGLFGGS